MHTRTLLACAASLFVLAAAPAASASIVSVFVPGDSNPNFAGQAAGACCTGDSVPGQSPVLALTGFADGSTMTFSATGTTDGAGVGPAGPDGVSVFDMADYNLGVASAEGVGVLGLLGVFLDASTPTFATQPSSIDYNGVLSFPSFAPAIGQMFWIGDGLTGTGSGASQVFTAPTGATRLYLGTVDGFGWNNNTGGYDVDINFTSGVIPEPATWTMMIVGFAGVGASLRAARRRTVPA